MSGRPLDVLEAAVGGDVEVRLKSGETYRGVLAGYDQHMNLVLEDVEAPTSDEPTAEEPTAAPGESGAEADGAVGPDDGRESNDAEPVEPRDTTIIRGDNVVSITP